jgi:hypothetical protein
MADPAMDDRPGAGSRSGADDAGGRRRGAIAISLTARTLRAIWAWRREWYGSRDAVPPGLLRLRWRVDRDRHTAIGGPNVDPALIAGFRRWAAVEWPGVAIGAVPAHGFDAGGGLSLDALITAIPDKPPTRAPDAVILETCGEDDLRSVVDRLLAVAGTSTLEGSVVLPRGAETGGVRLLIVDPPYFLVRQWRDSGRRLFVRTDPAALDDVGPTGAALVWVEWGFAPGRLGAGVAARVAGGTAHALLPFAASPIVLDTAGGIRLGELLTPAPIPVAAQASTTAAEPIDTPIALRPAGTAEREPDAGDARAWICAEADLRRRPRAAARALRLLRANLRVARLLPARDGAGSRAAGALYIFREQTAVGSPVAARLMHALGTPMVATRLPRLLRPVGTRLLPDSDAATLARLVDRLIPGDERERADARDAGDQWIDLLIPAESWTGEPATAVPEPAADAASDPWGAAADDTPAPNPVRATADMPVSIVRLRPADFHATNACVGWLRDDVPVPITDFRARASTGFAGPEPAR